MNRIHSLLETKKSNILSVYFTAGFPKLNDTAEIIHALAENGVDMIEIGIPFSDPLADGPVIQQSSQKALNNGMSLKLLFTQLADIRKTVNIPLLMMGYINPVMQFGVENFCAACARVGIDGIILPDLPLDIYVKEYKSIFEKHGLHNIFLITPQTNEQRIREIDDNSKGFIYAVSTSATTGARSTIATEQKTYFTRVQQMNLKNPILIGFGISNRDTFMQACSYAHGAIIGSAFVKAIAESIDLKGTIRDFVKSVR